MSLETLKRLFWPHATLALGIVVVLDYLTAVAVLIKIAAWAWLLMQLGAFPLGFAAAATTRFGRGVYAELFGLRIVRFFPLLLAGKQVFDALMVELQPTTGVVEGQDLKTGQDPGPVERVDDESRAPSLADLV